MIRRKALLTIIGAIGMFLTLRLNISSEPDRLQNLLNEPDLSSDLNLAAAAAIGEIIVRRGVVGNLCFDQLYLELKSEGVPLNDVNKLLAALSADYNVPSGIIRVDGWYLGQLESRLYALIYLSTI